MIYEEIVSNLKVENTLYIQYLAKLNRWYFFIYKINIQVVHAHLQYMYKWFTEEKKSSQLEHYRSSYPDKNL